MIRNHFKKGIAVGGLLLFSCSSPAPIDYLYDHCESCNFKGEMEVLSSKGNGYRFQIDPELGAIDVNIPPKVVGKKLYLKTKNDVVLGFDLTSKDSIISPRESIQLPNVYRLITDFEYIGSEKINFTTRDDSNYVYQYNAKSKKLDTLLNGVDMSWNAMPFIGLTFNKFRGDYVVPFLPIKDGESSCFLGHYDTGFKFKNSLGYGRTFEDQSYAPMFETPIISQLFPNGLFYACYSSSEQVVTCQITNDWQVNYGASICFPKTIDSKASKVIPRNQLANFEWMQKAHNGSSYVIRIVANAKGVYRITKLEQEEINPETRRVQAIIDAPWILDRYDRKKKTFARKNFEARTYIYASSFSFQGKEYFLTYSSRDSHEIQFDPF